MGTRWNFDAQLVGEGRLLGTQCPRCVRQIEVGDLVVDCEVLGKDGALDRVEIYHNRCAAKEVDDAIAERAGRISDGFERRGRDHLYDGYRTEPGELGWRLRQMFGWPPPDQVREGCLDEFIEAAFQEAASAQWYYTYEKDYGTFEEDWA